MIASYLYVIGALIRSVQYRQALLQSLKMTRAPAAQELIVIIVVFLWPLIDLFILLQTAYKYGELKWKK